MEEAAARAVMQVLWVLHARTDYSDVPLDVFVDKSKNHRCVKALALVPPGQLMLAPCALKTKSLSTNSVHPSRAQIRVKVFWPTAGESQSSGISTPHPKWRRTANTAAVAAGSDEKAGADSEETAVAAGSDEKAELKEVEIKKLFTFYVNPEWKGPEQDHDDPDMWNWQGMSQCTRIGAFAA